MSRDITMCHPKLQNLANELIKECNKKGLKIKLTECLRSVAEQDALYAKGRTVGGNIVTNASGSSMSSMHQWGVAFDICRNDGKGAYNDSDGFFTKVSVIGKSLGLEWGGDWVSIKDKPHYQLPNWGSTTAKLRQQYGNLDNFKKTWGTEQTNIKSNNVANGVNVNSNRKYNIYNLQQAINKDGIAKIKADGLYGKNTDEAVKKCVVKNGSSGYVVSWVQGGIGAKVDGKAGRKTTEKIYGFQYKYGLHKDGIAGYDTIKMVLKQYGK